MIKVPRVWPGRYSPLGAPVEPVGVNFAIFSENATKLELCFFDSPDAKVESVSGDGGSIGRWANSAEIGSVTGVVQ
jgi:pullulanase/glycogen debranching enzyme